MLVTGAAVRSEGCPRSYCRCRTAGPDLGERWPSRLVATAAEKRLGSKSNHSANPRRGWSLFPARSITGKSHFKASATNVTLKISLWRDPSKPPLRAPPMRQDSNQVSQASARRRLQSDALSVLKSLLLVGITTIALLIVEQLFSIRHLILIYLIPVV